MSQVKLDLIFKDDGLDAIGKKLKNIKKNSKIEMGNGYKDEKSFNKLLIQRYELQKKLTIAQRNGWKQAEENLKDMITNNKIGVVTSTLRLKKLDELIEREKSLNAETGANIQLKKKIETEDKKRLELIQKTGKIESTAHRLNETFNKNRQADIQKLGKIESNAHKMNEAFNKNRQTEIEKMGKTEYEAYLVNNKMELDKQKIIYDAYKRNEKYDADKNKILIEQQNWLHQQLIAIEKIGNYSGYDNLKEATRQYILQLDARKGLTQAQKDQYLIDKSLLSLAKQTTNEETSQNKTKNTNLYNLSSLRSRINLDEFVEKKKYTSLLDELSKKATAENFKLELASIKKLFEEERKTTLSLSELNAKKETEFLESRLANFKQSDFSFGGDASKDRIKIEETLSQARLKGWKQSTILATKYNKLMDDGYIISDKQWSKLKRTNVWEESNLQLIKKQTTEREKSVAQEKKANLDKLKLIEQQKFMLDKMEVGVKDKSKEATYNKLTSSIAKYQAKVKSGITLTQKEVNSLKLLEVQTKKSKGTLDEFVSAYALMGTLRKGFQILKQEIQYIRDLDQAVYNLGIVSKLSVSEIEDLKFQLLDMGAKFPASAGEIAEAMDTIGRTGVDFANNMEAIDDVIKLAISSGSDLASTAGIISKALVAFSLSGNQATQAIDAMHSVVLSSPLTLDSLNGSLANSSNAFATLIEFTNKSGAELEKYKEELLNLDLALTGGLAKIGVQASVAGTTIKFFISKLLASEKTSVKLFDNMNLTLEGTALTFERFAGIAKNDVKDAIQLLIDNFGTLSANQMTLQKMFTARHWTKIASLLASMGGSVSDFTDEMTTGNVVNDDYQKQLNNINVQLKQMEGKLANANSVFVQLGKDIMQDFIPTINVVLDLFSNLNNKLVINTIKAGSFGISLAALSTVAAILIQKLNILNKLKILSDPKMLIWLAIATTVSAISTALKDAQREQKRLAELAEKERLARVENLNSIKLSETQIKSYEKALEDIMDIDISEKWRVELDYISQAIEASKDYQEVLDNVDLSNEYRKLEVTEKSITKFKGLKKYFEKERSPLQEKLDNYTALNKTSKIGTGNIQTDLIIMKNLTKFFEKKMRETPKEKIMQDTPKERKILEKQNISIRDFSAKDKRSSKFLGDMSEREVEKLALEGVDMLTLHGKEAEDFNSSTEAFVNIYEALKGLSTKLSTKELNSELSTVQEALDIVNSNLHYADKQLAEAEGTLNTVIGTIKSKITSNNVYIVKMYEASMKKIFEMSFNSVAEFESKFTEKIKNEKGEDTDDFKYGKAAEVYEDMKKQGLMDELDKENLSESDKVKIVNSEIMRKNSIEYAKNMDIAKRYTEEIGRIETAITTNELGLYPMSDIYLQLKEEELEGRKQTIKQIDLIKENLIGQIVLQDTSNEATKKATQDWLALEERIAKINKNGIELLKLELTYLEKGKEIATNAFEEAEYDVQILEKKSEIANAEIKATETLVGLKQENIDATKTEGELLLNNFKKTAEIFKIKKKQFEDEKNNLEITKEYKEALGVQQAALEEYNKHLTGKEKNDSIEKNVVKSSVKVKDLKAKIIANPLDEILISQYRSAVEERKKSFEEYNTLLGEQNNSNDSAKDIEHLLYFDLLEASKNVTKLESQIKDIPIDPDLEIDLETASKNKNDAIKEYNGYLERQEALRRDLLMINASELEILNLKLTQAHSMEAGLKKDIEVATINKAINDYNTKKKKEALALLQEQTSLKQQLNRFDYTTMESLDAQLDDNQAILASIDLQTAGIEEQNQYYQAQLNIKNIDLAKEKEKTDEIKKQLELKKSGASSAISSINKITSGQGYTPSFNQSGVSSLIGNIASGGYDSKTKDSKIASDLGDSMNFILTQYSNIATLTNQREQQTINNRINMLEIEKSLLTDEEDIQAKDDEILQKKLNLIDLQAQQVATQSVTGGITSGLTSGLMAGFAGGGPLGGLAVGAISVLGGLFGASKADKDADIAKEQLLQQEETNRLLEIQNDNLKALEEYQQIGAKFGSLKANEKIDDPFTAFYKGIQQSMVYKDIKTGEQITLWDTGGEYIDAETTGFKTNIDSLKELKSEIAETDLKISSLKASTKELSKDDAFESVTDAKAYISDISDLEAYEGYARSLKDIDSKMALSQSKWEQEWFNYSVTLDEASGEIKSAVWETHSDILNSFIDNASTGFVNLGNIISETFSTGILNNFVKNSESIYSIIDNIESKMGNIIQQISEGKNIFDIRNEEYYIKLKKIEDTFYNYTPIRYSGKNLEAIAAKSQTNYDARKKIYDDDIASLKLKYLPIMSEVISETEKLKLEQQKANEFQSDYVQGWIDFGGKISDVSNIMFTGVYDGISTALDETNYVDRFDSLGESLGSSLFSKMKQEMIDSNYGGLLAELNTQMVEAMDYGTAMNMGTISDIAQEIQKITAQTEYDALKLESAMSLFDVGDIDYVNQSQGITYETGTSSSLQVIYQNTFSNNIGNIVTTTDQTSINKLVDVLLPTIAERLETQLGKYFK